MHRQPLDSNPGARRMPVVGNHRKHPACASGRGPRIHRRRTRSMHPFWRSVRLYIVLLLALVLPLLGASQSQAQGETMVVATWGGAYTDAFREAFADPFSEETGVEVQIVDAPGGYNAMLEAQAAAGNVTWDLIDIGEEDAVALIHLELLQPLPDELKG